MCYGKNLYYKKLWIAYNNFTWGQIKRKECPGAPRKCNFSGTNATWLYIQSFKEHFPAIFKTIAK